MSGHLSTFFTIALTQTISLIGSRMTSIALGIWVFEHTGLAAPLLLTAFFAELPGMLGGSLAGVLVDRWDRRHVLMLADAGQAVGTLLLMVSFLSGGFRIWQLYLVALFQGSFAIFQSPARDAATTMLVSEAQRERANAVLEMTFPLAGVVAPVLTGLLYGTVGVTGVMATDLATFLVAVSAVYLIRIPHPKATAEGTAARGRLRREWLTGLRFLWERRPLLCLVLYLTVINFLLNGPLELAIPYLILLTGSKAVAGGLMGVMSVGAFSGAVLIAVWGGTRPRMHTLMPSLLFAGAMFVVYGMVRTAPLLGLASFLLMLPLPVSSAVFISILQVKTPPDMQGRIFALVSQLDFLGSTTSFLSIGLLVDRVLEPAVGRAGWRPFVPLVGDDPGAGMGLLLVVTGLTILASTAAVYLWAEVRHLEATLPDYAALAEQ